MLEPELEAAERELHQIGWLLFGWSVVLAALVVVVLHFLAAWGLGASGWVSQTVVLTPVWLLALALIAVLIVAHWRTRNEPENTRWYLVAIVASTATIGVAAQAFAAMNVYLDLRGVVDAKTTPSLWSAEMSYLWHLLASVPFLDVPSTLRWSEPSAFRDHASGTLLLAFKIAVLGPFIGLAFACYHALEGQRQRAQDDAAEGRRRARNLAVQIRIGAGGAVGVFVLLLALVIGVYLISTFVFDPTSQPNRWLAERIPNEVEVRDFLVPLAWAEVVPQALVVAILAWVVAVVIALAFLVDAPADGAAWRLVGPLGAYLCLLVLVAELWSALTLTLLHWGLATAAPTLPPSEHVSSTVGYYAWHGSDVLPALDVPETLNFSLQTDFVDGVSPGLLLVYKVAFLAVLAFPVMRVVRSYSARWRRGQPQAMLNAVHSFTASLRQISAELDAAEARVLPTLGPGSRMLRPYRGGGEALATAKRRVGRLTTELEPVIALFGPGEVTERARAAVAATTRRLDEVEARDFRLTWGSPVADDLRAAKSESDAALAAYEEAAAGALERGAPEPSPS